MEGRRFDYRFLKENISGEMLSIASIISDLRGRGEIRKASHESLFAELRKAAIVDSVESSNAIEGIVSTKDRIAGLVAGETMPKTHDEKEILGYKRALDNIYTNFADLEPTENLLREFHRQMQGATARDAGQYKKENNWLQERDADGRISVRFVPTRANDVPDAMRQMLLAYYEARQDSAISPLLLIPCVTVDFLCVHPFRDGNGRVSRLFTNLLLLRADYDIGRFVSVERMINTYKAAYYRTLKASSDGWHENESDYTPFITFFLQILYACYKELDERFVDGQAGKVPKARRVEEVLLNAFVPISKEEICARLPDISVTTVERVLGAMQKDGRIVKIGSYRDARYKSNG